ncbi:MAG: UvrB/UvrC motif-containing protein [Candidatus Campbellbacteria bacterium]|nr:UvrB/UvrC motif-containing protein [Candidatus Campbellbacteria bacterium]
MSISKKLIKSIAKLPESPGVYFFHGAKSEILYIGKATSLRDRVKSYLSGDLLDTRGPLINKMVGEAEKVTYVETDSVLEALILEANLIKKHQPEYNSRDKDNKSWNFVVITNEKFPRVLIERARTLPERFGEEDIKYQFGPFTSGSNLRRALKIVRKLFPFRDKCTPFVELTEKQKDKARKCFNAQIGLCPGVCVGEVDKKEYARNIQHIKLFFEGRKKALIRSLERDMKKAARSENFEKAESIKRTLFALDHINDTALISREEDIDSKYAKDKSAVRIEGYDVSHFGGSETIGVMVVVEDGYSKKSDYRRFKIRNSKSGDTGALEEILERRFKHDEWQTPDVLVTDGGRAQLNVAKRVVGNLENDKKERIKVVSVVKDEKHRPREIIGSDKKVIEKYNAEILLANSEAHRFAIAFQKERRKKGFI